MPRDAYSAACAGQRSATAGCDCSTQSPTPTTAVTESRHRAPRARRSSVRHSGAHPARHLCLGRDAEDLAAAHLQAAGAEIVLRNYRRRRGELDIVALHRGVVLIVEVRLRSSASHGGGAASVDRCKQRRIIHAARQLLQQRRDLARHAVRFDVIALSPQRTSGNSAGWHVDWLQHAFEVQG
ncbi:MAG: YraN family protein [Gammaproteobacteria bacterium]|nr:YraN family protein [Gammaproteobacteria bacterium]